jgi:hypothetical protein
MMSLLSLPNELLIMIAGHLEEDIKSLDALSKVCRELWSVGQKVLFRSLLVDCASPAYQITECPLILLEQPVYHGPAKFARLIRTLQERSDLAHEVKSLRFSISLRFNRDDEQYLVNEDITMIGWNEEATARAFLKQCQAAFAGITGTQKGPIYHESKRYKVRAYKLVLQSTLAGLLMLLVPNMTKLDVTIQEHAGSHSESDGPLFDLFDIEDGSIGSSSIFKPLQAHLENVKELTTSLPSLSIIYLFVGLKRLHIRQFPWGPHRLSKDFRTVVPGPWRHSQLDTLTMEACTFELQAQNDHSRIWKTMAFLEFNKLKNLTIIIRGNLRQRVRPRTTGYAALVNNVARVAGTLESLEIDHTYDIGEVFHDRGRVRPCEGLGSSLFQFTRLRELAIPEPALAHSRPGRLATYVLPTTLEELTVYHPTRKILAWFDSLLTALSDLPILRTVTVKCRSIWGRSAAWFRMQEDPVFQRLEEREVKVRILQDQTVAVHINGDVVARVIDETNIWQNDDEESWLALFDNVEIGVLRA